MSRLRFTLVATASQHGLFMKTGFRQISRHIGTVIGAVIVALVMGCDARDDTPADEGTGLMRIVLQTDWYAQPEHGGFYQALVQGYYAEEGLAVEIRPGGPNANTMQRVVLGEAHFSMGRSDEIILGVSRGLPLVMVGALMQKDPLAIMFHRSSGIERFEDLDGRTIMANPGFAYLELMRRTYDIDFSVIPMDYGMERFIADPHFVQQVFVTNEPYYVRKHGADPQTLLLTDSGFNPYQTWYTSRSFLRSNPEAVAAFTRASIRGWRDYLFGDRTEANAMIASRNARMTEDFIAYSVKTLIERNLVTGETGNPEMIGHIDPERIAEQIEQLTAIGMLDQPPAVGVVFDDRFLPDATKQAGARKMPRISLLKEATGPTDLAVSIPAESRTGYLSPEIIAGLGTSTLQMRLEVTAAPVELEVVSLEHVIRGLGLVPAEWTVTADCSDGYWSVFEPDTLERSKPWLVMGINSQTVAEWAEQQGRPEWGPYLIQISSPLDLLDPSHKNPWGVERLTLRPAADIKAAIGARVDRDDPRVTEGMEIYLNSCASCHASRELGVGGSTSLIPAQLLGMHALSNEAYFRAMLRDPGGTNPEARKMPAYRHYTPQQVTALLTFLRDYVQD